MERSSIVPLKETNYASWKIQCRMALIKENWFGIVMKKELAPSGENSSVELGKFEVRRNKALALIVLGMDPSLLHLVGKIEDPSELWTKLESTFQKKTFANRLRLKRKLYSIKFKSSVNEHLKELIEIFDELAIIGDEVLEEDQVLILLSTLPEKFQGLVTAFETQDKVPSWITVTERLLHAEEKTRDVKDETALYSKNKRKFTKTCYFCRMPGHFKSTCSKYLEYLKKKDGERTMKNNSAKIIHNS